MHSKEQFFDLFVRYVRSGSFNNAIQTELLYYNSYVKPLESIEGWDYWDDNTRELRERVSTIGLIGSKHNDLSFSQNDSLVFVFHNFSGLAHEQQILRALLDLNQSGSDFPVCVVYLFGDRSREQAAGKFWVRVSPKIYFFDAKSYTDSFFLLESFCRDVKARTVIYPSIYFLASWACALTSHPDQRFLVMKYTPRICGRFSAWGGGMGKAARAKALSQIPFFEVPVRLPFSQIERSCLGQSPTRFNFGSISRVEKIRDSRYLEFVLSILTTDTRFVYLITCRDEELITLPDDFRNHPQVRNLGWVDPKGGILDFDVYVEPFPWGGGDMSFLAITQGLPYVALRTPEMFSVGPLDTVLSISHGHSRLDGCIATSLDEYRALIVALLTDPSERELVGASWHNAATAFQQSRGVDGWRRFLGPLCEVSDV